MKLLNMLLGLHLKEPYLLRIKELEIFMHQDETITESNITVNIIPFWKWILI